MKGLKIVAVTSGILTFLQLLPVILQRISLIRAWINIKHASAIGIIGGADGPTAVVVASDMPIIAGKIFFILCALTFVVSAALYKYKKTKDGK